MSASEYRGGGGGGGGVARVRGLPSIFLLVGILAGCAAPQVAPPVPAQVPARRIHPASLLGRRFDVIPAESLLTILVYRAGALAMLGHDHVVSCRCVSGAVYVPHDPLRAGFDLRVPVAGFTVDDPKSRAAEHSADFPPDVPRGAQEATRHNMLSAALLNGGRYPEIRLRSAGLCPSPDGKPGDIIAQVLLEVAGRQRSIAVPLHSDIRTDRVMVRGEFPLKLTDLGLVPFSAAGGALKVRDGMEVRLSLVARRAGGVSPR